MKKTVLAVDDSKTVLNMLDLYMKGKYDLISTTSGEDALQILNSKPVDIVLLDYMMPMMNGMEVLKRIREKEEFADLPVLFLTSDAHRATVVESFQSGCQGYILKPVAKENLLERLKAGLEKQEQGKEDDI